MDWNKLKAEYIAGGTSYRNLAEKYKDEGVLPLTPEKYKRIMIVPVKGYAGPMDALMQY